MWLAYTVSPGPPRMAVVCGNGNGNSILYVYGILGKNPQKASILVSGGKEA